MQMRFYSLMLALSFCMNIVYPSTSFINRQTNSNIITTEQDTIGDVNADGTFTIADIIIFTKWLLAVPNVELNNWKAADFDDDNCLDVFDLSLMKCSYLNNYFAGDDVKDLQILEQAKTILSNPGETNNYFAWPSIARLQNGRLAVTCSGFRRGHLCPFGTAVMMISEDDGKNYSLPFPVIDTPLDDRDAGVVPFGDNGVMITSFNNTRASQRLWNPNNSEYMAYIDTITDEDERKYLGSTFRLSFDCGNTFGDIFISPVTSPHGPIVLSNGDLIWVGRTFADDGILDENDRIEAWQVALNGSMHFLGAIPPIYQDGVLLNSCEPSVIELNDGTLLCHLRVQNNGLFTIFQSKSVDKGITWSEPVQLLSDSGGSPPHLIIHSSGTLICSYGYRAGPDYGIRIMISYDMGTTWKTDIILWDEGVSSDLGYPATCELSDGTLLTVFYAKDEVDGPAEIKQIHWKLLN